MWLVLYAWENDAILCFLYQFIVVLLCVLLLLMLVAIKGFK